MAENRGFKGLAAWQASMELVLDVYRVSSHWPDAEKFNLTSQARRAAVSVPSNIAEGHGRRTNGDFGRFVSIASGSLAELETQLLLAKRLGFSSQDDLDPLLRKIDETAKVLQGLSRYLRQTTNDPE